MSKENENVTEVGAQAPVRKPRRGITNETQATSQLRFHEKDAAPNRLFMAHLHNVSVAWSVVAILKMQIKCVMYIILYFLSRVMLILFLAEVKNGNSIKL